MSSDDDVRRLATALPEVSERASYGTPAFYVAGRIFARLHQEPGVLVCWRADMGERQALLDSDPEKFFTTDHYKGHASVLVRLDRVAEEELAELLDEAWAARAPRRTRGPSGDGAARPGRTAPADSTRRDLSGVPERRTRPAT